MLTKFFFKLILVQLYITCISQISLPVILIRFCVPRNRTTNKHAKYQNDRLKTVAMVTVCNIDMCPIL